MSAARLSGHLGVPWWGVWVLTESSKSPQDGENRPETTSATDHGNRRSDALSSPDALVTAPHVFSETKIWISDYGYEETLHGFEKSASKLGVDQIDLLILHQALPSAFDRPLAAYRALETLLVDGRVRAIGVSNFMVEHLAKLLDTASVVPAVNQIECHPFFAQRSVQESLTGSQQRHERS